MNRRGFFKALVATAVIAAATSTRLGQTVFDVVKSGYRYVLHGDGETDDTEALQAFLSGEEVIYRGGALGPINGVSVLPPAAYKISETIELNDSTPAESFNNYYPQTLAEFKNQIHPVDVAYPPGDVRRYGAAE